MWLRGNFTIFHKPLAGERFSQWDTVSKTRLVHIASANKGASKFTPILPVTSEEAEFTSCESSYVDDPHTVIMDISDRIALVVGASSGIGRATAEALAREGVQVGLAARRETKLEEFADQIEADGGDAVAVPTDIREEEQVASMVETTRDIFGGLDILVNSAGVGQWKSVADADPDEWRREVEVNLLGLMNATRVAVPALAEQQSGHIVTVSSMSARYPGPGWPGYTATKFGVNGFTQAILRDVRQEGIRVTLIEPGDVDTPMQTEEARNARRILDPGDVADTILYAVSRPEHVCVNDIQLVPTEPHPGES